MDALIFLISLCLAGSVCFVVVLFNNIFNSAK